MAFGRVFMRCSRNEFPVGGSRFTVGSLISPIVPIRRIRIALLTAAGPNRKLRPAARIEDEYDDENEYEQ
jgi:hypothetical protein